MTSAPNCPDDQQPRNVGDPYQDLLSVLADGPRKGFLQRLATGYYEGWRPTRAQVANLIARETGRITEDEYLAELVGSKSSPEARQQFPSNNSPGRIKEQPSPMEVVGPPRGTQVDGNGRPVAATSTMQSFTVHCGELVPHWDFVARGLAGGAWVKRGGRMYRLISLQYELVPRRSAPEEPDQPGIFTAQITCLANIPAPREPLDGRSVSHSVRAGRIFGVRGPWPVSPDVRRIRFLIYPQQPPGDQSERHPAGALWVDLTSGQAHWRQITERHVDQFAAPIMTTSQAGS